MKTPTDRGSVAKRLEALRPIVSPIVVVTCLVVSVVLLQAFYGATGFACAATVILLSLALTASIMGAYSARGATQFSAAGG